MPASNNDGPLRTRDTRRIMCSVGTGRSCDPDVSGVEIDRALYGKGHRDGCVSRGVQRMSTPSGRPANPIDLSNYEPRRAHERAIAKPHRPEDKLTRFARLTRQSERTTLLALSGILSKIQICHRPASPATRSRVTLISSGLKPAFAGCSVRKLQ